MQSTWNSRAEIFSVHVWRCQDQFVDGRLWAEAPSASHLVKRRQQATVAHGMGNDQHALGPGVLSHNLQEP